MDQNLAMAILGIALTPLGDKCPSTHPIRIPQVMYEIMYDTAQFNDPDYWTNGTQPLVYSFGDASVLSFIISL